MRRISSFLLAAALLSAGSLSLAGCIVVPARGHAARVWVPGHWTSPHVWVSGHWRYR